MKSFAVMFASVVTIRALVAELSQRGIPASELLMGTRVRDEQLHDMRTMLRLDEYEHIVDRAIQLTRNPAIGLSVGNNAPESLFQIVAFLALSVPSVGQAIEVMARYAPLLVDDLRVSLSRDGSHALLRYDFHCGVKGTLLRFAAECLTATCLRVGFQHFAPDDRPHELRFQYPAPDYVDRYYAAFRCPLRFEQADNAILFDAAVLDRAQPYTDRAMEIELRKTADHMLVHMASPSYSERLRSMLRQESDLCNLETDRMAHSLGLSMRTLRRRLADEGASFGELIEEVRNEIACSELRRPGSSIREVAERLGYSEPSAFHRAFKRWTGETPQNFRRAATSPEASAGLSDKNPSR